MKNFTFSPSMLMMPRKLPHSAWLGHIPFASWLLDVQRPRSIVELGTHNGASFLALCQAVEAFQLSARVYAVDTWAGDEHAGFYGNEIYAELRDYQQRHYAGISEMMRMRFDQALEYFADGSIDLLHIDGLHTYEAVREDFETWRSKLSPRAVVLFHDSCVRERGFGVWQYWSEISSQFPSFEFTHTHGLGVLLVGDQQPAELLELATAANDGGFAVINQLFDALGRNIKNVEEIERVNAGLAAAHGELARLSSVEQALNEQLSALHEQSRQIHTALDSISQLGRQQHDVLESRLPELNEAMDNVQRLLEQGHERTEQHIAIARDHTVASLMDAVVPRLDAQSEKIDQVLRPWWRRGFGR
jgi:methyl-accepting chemotaxis protein